MNVGFIHISHRLNRPTDCRSLTHIHMHISKLIVNANKLYAIGIPGKCYRETFAIHQQSTWQNILNAMRTKYTNQRKFIQLHCGMITSLILNNYSRLSAPFSLSLYLLLLYSILACARAKYLNQPPIYVCHIQNHFACYNRILCTGTRCVWQLQCKMQWKMTTHDKYCVDHTPTRISMVKLR